MQVDYGKPISIIEANEMYSNLQSIKDRTKSTIESALASDKEALRYYLCKEIAFVFSKESITKLAKIIELYGNDAGVLFYSGVKFDEAASVGGRPTLMAFAYNTFIDPITKKERIAIITSGANKEIVYSNVVNAFVAGQEGPLITATQKDGEEHPGGGKPGGSFIYTPIIPTSFNLEDIQTFR